MKLSTKGRYAMRAMLELANNYYENKNKLIDLKQIADKQSLPLKYLEHLISDLKKSGLVYSERGFLGGYRLIHDPQEIDLYAILNATENVADLVNCLDDDFVCEMKTLCATIDIWTGLKKVIVDYFQSISLKDLYNIEQRKKKHASA